MGHVLRPVQMPTETAESAKRLIWSQMHTCAVATKAELSPLLSSIAAGKRIKQEIKQEGGGGSVGGTPKTPAAAGRPLKRTKLAGDESAATTTGGSTAPSTAATGDHRKRGPKPGSVHVKRESSAPSTAGPTPVTGDLKTKFASEEERQLHTHGGKLDVSLTAVLDFLRDLGRRPAEHAEEYEARPEVAAALRWREKAHTRSSVNVEEQLGLNAQQALQEVRALIPFLCSNACAHSFVRMHGSLLWFE